MSSNINPTWIQTTHGGSPTNVAQDYEEVDRRIEYAIERNAPCITLDVATGVPGKVYRRTFFVAHIVQYGSTIHVE